MEFFDLINIDLTGIIATFLTAILFPIVKDIVTKHRQKIQDELVLQIIGNVVLYVEQTMKSESGQDKLTRTIETVQLKLDELGIDIDASEIIRLIESQVYKLINVNKKATWES